MKCGDQLPDEAGLRRMFRELSGFEMPPRGLTPVSRVAPGDGKPPRPPMRCRNGPPPDMGRAVRWWLVGMLTGAAMWVLLLGTAWWALGCATGHVSPDGEMVCAAIGESAEVLYSSPQGDAGILTTAPTKQVACRGGPLVPSLLDGVGTMFRALWALLPWAV